VLFSAWKVGSPRIAYWSTFSSVKARPSSGFPPLVASLPPPRCFFFLERSPFESAPLSSYRPQLVKNVRLGLPLLWIFRSLHVERIFHNTSKRWAHGPRDAPFSPSGQQCPHSQLVLEGRILLIFPESRVSRCRSGSLATIPPFHKP